MRFHNLLRVSWSVASGLGLLAAGQAAAASSPRSARVETRPALAADPASGDRVPLSLAAADFDGDGTRDLAVGFQDVSGGGVSVHSGNPDAVYPNTPEARRRRAEGSDAAVFGAATSLLRPGFLPGLLAAGDFDADGRADVAAFADGEDAAVLFSGDGRGGFSAARAIALPGPVTAVATGELGRRDGLPDLAVAVEAPGGSRLLLFASPRGAFGAAPAQRPLEGPAAAVAVGFLDEDAWGDAAAAVGSTVVILRGADDVRGAISLAADFERHETGVPLAAIAAADVEGDERPEIAAVGEDGALRVLARPERRGEHPVAVSEGAWEAREPVAGFEEAVSDPRVFSARLSSLARPDVRAEAAQLSRIPRAVAALPMRLDADARADLVLIEEGAGAPSILTASSLALAPEAIYVVNVADNTVDANVGDGICADINGNCSLRAAIQTANAHAGADIVHFAIPGGTPTILLTTGGSLPIITDPITIDGTTQAQGMVNIDGVNNATIGDGIRISAGSSVVRGLAIFRIIGGSGVGLRLETNGGNVIEGNRIGIDSAGALRGIQGTGIWATATSPGNQIGGTVPAARNVVGGANYGIFTDSNANILQGNYLGTDPTGMLDYGNDNYGIRVFTGASCTVGGAVPGAGNLVSGNTLHGLRLDTQGNFVAGNVVGLNAAGTDALPNGSYGIYVEHFDNTIGGPTPAARNVISGNALSGIYSYTRTTIQGNYIGTNAAGTAAVPNGGNGILITSLDDCVIGGAAPGEGNLISGNALDGVRLNFSPGFGSARGNVVRGNRIGTDFTGTVALPNLRDGIAIDFNSGGNTIGGAAAGEGNLISGNGRHGVFLSANTASDGPNVIQGNWVGTNFLGTGALPNTGSGLYYVANSSGVLVGGTNPGEANRFAFNGGPGVASEGNRIVLVGVNEIFGNAGLGIDRFDNGVTANTAGSSSNAPVIVSATTAGGVTTVSGTLSAAGPAGLVYTLHFFSNETCDPSGYGEGAVYAGSALVTVDGTGVGSFSHPLASAVPGGRFLTAFSVAPSTYTGRASEFSFCRLVSGDPAPPPTVNLSITTAVPSRGGNTAEVSVRITGEGIRPGATARLVRAGFADIAASYNAADPSGGSLVVTFPLAGRVAGFWDVVVTNPDTTTDSLPGAFEIVAGSGPRIWSQLLGRPVIRPGRVATFTLVYGNRGDVDAHAVPLYIEGIPGDATVELVTSLTNPPFFGTETPPDFDSVVPVVDRADGTRWIPLVVPILPPNATRAVTFRITVPTVRTFFLSAAHGSPWLGSPMTADQRKCIASIIKLIVQLIPGADCIVGVAELVLGGATAAVNPTSDTVYGAVSSYWGVLWDCLSAFIPIGQVLEFAKDMIDLVRNGASTLKECGDAFPDPFEIHVVNSSDPNVKVGPSGAGALGWINPVDPLAYEVHFENMETATAPAQDVVVTDQLDAAVFDLASFEFGAVHVGTKSLAAPVPGTDAFTGEIDLRPETDSIARVTGEINRATGLVTWRFLSIDPATGQPEEDPLGGFLPPNTTAPRGEGFVTFRVRVKASVADGQTISNAASIVFDLNPPIATPVWSNTIDRLPPQSQVTPIGASTCGITVSWTGSDQHSGVASYDVFVSKDGGAYEPLVRTWTSPSVTFEGLPGSTYAFFSVARDGAGNVESPPMAADATYTVTQTGPAVSSVTPDLGPHSGGTVLTITGGPFDPGSTVEVRGFPVLSVQFVSPTELQATMRALPGGVLNEVAVINPGGCKGIWTGTFFTQFEDVTLGHPFGPFIANLVRASVTAGCGTGIYCPESAVTRAQMAVFLLRSKEGPTYVPPPCVTPAFPDVPCASPFAPWVNELAVRQVTSGCGGGYCPNDAVTREQMAVFLLRTLEGPAYVPPDCTVPTFNDVACASPFAKWIEELVERGITAGCGGGSYCPTSPNTRGQMAVFLSATFGLP